MSGSKPKDYSGQVKHGVEALSFSHQQERTSKLGNIRKVTIWNFRCHCGIEFKKSVARWARGETKSCGCTTHPQKYQPGYVNDHGVKVVKRERKNGQSVFHCECPVCDAPFTKDYLAPHTPQSCGCAVGKYRDLEHNSKSKTYNSWDAMKQRCLNPGHPDFHHYGGRGITICDRWLDPADGYRNFLEDMGPRPAGKTMDRVNPNGNYEPANCRWATDVTQNNNQRRHLDAA